MIDIFLATVIGFGIGGVWYSPQAFGPTWKKATGITAHDIKVKHTPTSMIAGVLSTFIGAVILNVILERLRIATIGYGLLVAVLLWLGFQATTLIERNLWENVPGKLFLITAGHRLVVTIVMTLILLTL